VYIPLGKNVYKIRDSLNTRRGFCSPHILTGASISTKEFWAKNKLRARAHMPKISRSASSPPSFAKRAAMIGSTLNGA
jgi:hypothetical protein